MAKAPVENNVNDNGHTIYPKVVYPNGMQKNAHGKPDPSCGVTVNDAEEEAEIMKAASTEKEAPKETKKKDDWGDKK